MFLVLLLGFSTLAASYILPSPSFTSDAPFLNSPNDQCTFKLFHRQHHSLNYIQINALTDHANDIVVDIAALRPAAAFNSYTRVAEDQVFAIMGLLDDEQLTIKGKDGSDTLEFSVGEWEWTSRDMRNEVVGRWCEVGAWRGDIVRRVSLTDLV